MISPIIKTIRKDPQYKKFKTVWVRVQKDLDIDVAVEECKILHNARLSTKIKDNKGQFSPQQLFDANAIDLSTRSRMSFIAANLQLRLSKLDSALDAIQNYILNTYSKDIGVRTIDGQKKFVRRVLKQYIELYEQGKAALEFIQVLIRDIDQTGYAMRNMVDCVKLLSETKGKVI